MDAGTGIRDLVFDPLLMDTPLELCSVLVAGGGIAGIQAALDAADSEFYVYLVEKTADIGGAISQLDKTSPTNDCAM